MTFLKAINLWSFDKAGQIKKPEVRCLPQERIEEREERERREI
jgi:hypothetical protein